MKKSILLITVVLSLLISCVEEYESKVSGNNNFLIVEAMITNATEPYEVKLSRTINLKDDETIYETGAIVVVSDDLDNQFYFDEVEQGIYRSNTSEFIGQVGKRYMLNIYTLDGDVYESDRIELNNTIDIDSVYITYSQEEIFGENRYVNGIDINVATTEWNNGENYYLKWDYIETYKLFPIHSVMGRPDIPHIPCYNIIKSSEIITDNTSNYTTNRISKKKLLNINENETKPYLGYSILVRQSTLNEAVFQFWNMLKENTEENGNVFDKIPYNAISNIHCVNDDDKKVLGYFNASEVAEKRLSFKPPVFDIKFHNFYDKCVPIAYTTDEFNTYLEISNIDSTDIYIYDVLPGSIQFFLRRECVDCSVNSTTTIEPDYWPFE